MVEAAAQQHTVEDLAETVTLGYCDCDSAACRCGLCNIYWAQEGYGFRMDEWTDDFAC